MLPRRRSLELPRRNGQLLGRDFNPQDETVVTAYGKPKLSYQVHRAVDERCEIITATDATPGDVNEAHVMSSLIEKHESTTGTKTETVVADSKYGTIDNFLDCLDKGIKAHIPDLRLAALKRTKKRSIFTDDQFVYDPTSDTYTCPAGNQLKRKSLHKQRESSDYGAPKKVCSACKLREQCTKNKSGRTVKRHLRQDELNTMRERSRLPESRRDIKTRQHLMERSFAKATRYGFDHARWRGLGKMKIQEYLTCAIQNIQALIRHGGKPSKAIDLRIKLMPAIITKAISLAIRPENWLFCGIKADFGLCFQRA